MKLEGRFHILGVSVVQREAELPELAAWEGVLNEGFS